MLSDKDKKQLVNKTKKILEIRGINIDVDDLNPTEIIGLITDISDAIKSSINITTYIQDTEMGQRPLIVMQIILEVISDPELESFLSEDIKTKIKDFANNTETMGTLLNVFSWINNGLLELLDTNNDGKVSALETEVACYNFLVCNRGGGGRACYSTGGCCACCDPLSQKISKIFSEIFMRICCCGCSENQIAYDSDAVDVAKGKQVNVDL